MKNDKIELLEQLYIAAQVISDHGKILWANPYAVNLLGYLPNDYVDHNIQEVRHMMYIICARNTFSDQGASTFHHLSVQTFSITNASIPFFSFSSITNTVPFSE